MQIRNTTLKMFIINIIPSEDQRFVIIILKRNYANLGFAIQQSALLTQSKRFTLHHG